MVSAFWRNSRTSLSHHRVHPQPSVPFLSSPPPAFAIHGHRAIAKNLMRVYWRLRPMMRRAASRMARGWTGATVLGLGMCGLEKRRGSETSRKRRRRRRSQEEEDDEDEQERCGTCGRALVQTSSSPGLEALTDVSATVDSSSSVSLKELQSLRRYHSRHSQRLCPCVCSGSTTRATAHARAAAGTGRL
ncbi:uncharacterized protein J3D65DRAFT_310589 [Phyllosticta citribraziliensis]|uniref:Uncharacterized protein n=1 Tax=Phyllosticta citribraziliensis TaxID=989973 RepID=A0ABR1LY23_9PEZI